MATFILYVFNLFIYLLILVRMIRTNHWTTGKKILIGLIGSIAWYQGVAAYLFTVCGLTIPFSTVILYMLPLTVMGAITFYAIYRKQLE